MERPAPEQMHVEMKHRLPGSRTHVKYGPISLLDRSLPGYFRRCQMALPDQFSIFATRLFQTCNVLLRDDQNVCRGLRIDVIKGKRVFILVHLFRRYFSTQDAAKQTISHENRSF
jgi:hypothetical protein